MLSIFSYGKVATSKFNIESIVNKIIQLKDTFRCDYEISRILIGIASILKLGENLSNGTLVNMMNSLPSMVYSLCKLRTEGDHPQNDIEMDDEAQED